MTKKDYTKLARVIADTCSTYRDVRDANPQAVAYVLADTLARELALDNPRFDRTRFMKACGLITGERALS